MTQRWSSGLLPAPLNGYPGFKQLERSIGDLGVPMGGRTVTTLDDYLANNSWFNVKDYSALGDNIADDRTAFVNTATAATTVLAAIYVPPGTFQIATNLTITRGVGMAAGAILKPRNGITITINGGSHFPLQKCFDLSLGGRIVLGRGVVTEVYPTWWGALADGVRTNEDVEIQAAIDCVIYGGTGCRVKLWGKYLTGNTVNMGYGNTFNSVTVEGDQYMFRGQEFVPNCTGACIIYLGPADRPAIAINGARGSRLRRVAIEGGLTSWIYNRLDMGYGHGTGPVLDDTDPANWVDPSLAASQESRYAPYAGVAIDPYAGVKPVGGYPDQPIPWWIGAIGQYNRGASSDVCLEDVYIRGFNTAVVNQPCDYDGNGDFTSLVRVYMEFCKWGVSVGNTQARNTSLSDCKSSHMYCALVNNIHGKQQGVFEGTVRDLSMWGISQIFQLGAFYAEPITFLQCYAEALWRIGTLTALSSTEAGVIFDACNFHFSNQTDDRGYPAYILDGGQQHIDMRFRGTRFEFYNNASVYGINQVGITIEGLTIYRTQAAYTHAYEMQANNGLAGGLVLPAFTNPDHAKIKFAAYNLDTLALDVVSQFTGTQYKHTSRKHCIPVYGRHVVSEAATNDYGPLPLPNFMAVAKSSLTTCSLSGATLTITFAARTDAAFMQGGPDVGDAVFDNSTGMCFWVRSRTGTTILCDVRSNYKLVAGVVTPLVAFSGSVGVLSWTNCRFYTPTYPIRGDLTAASAVLTTVGRGDGFATFIDTDIVVGDALFIEDYIFRPISPTNAGIAARSAAAFTITLGAAILAGYTEVRHALRWFVRQPPANFP